MLVCVMAKWARVKKLLFICAVSLALGSIVYQLPLLSRPISSTDGRAVTNRPPSVI